MKSYQEACHAMQSGVAMMMNYESAETEPKHLRVGINSAMVNDAALVSLLVAKGIITMDEYAQAVTEEMNREAERYEQRVREATGGANITLH